MPVIALVGNKGGAGKTTLAINLAAGIAKLTSVIVIDADPQGSAMQWSSFTASNFPKAVIKASDDLRSQVTSLAENYNYIIIDCPPSVQAPQTIDVLSVCDMALIPVQPSPVDLWATVHTEKAVQQARHSNPNLRAILVVNQLESRTTLSLIVRDALAEIDLPVTKTALHRRAVFKNSAMEGKSVFQMGRRGSAAVGEIEELIQEVIMI